MADINQISGAIIGVTIRIHKRLGPGLLESAYHDLLVRDLVRKGFFVENKKRVGFEFEGSWIENGLVTDLIVERQIIVEIKSVQTLGQIHYKQLLTYLRLLDLRLGLLLNFGGPVLPRRVSARERRLQEDSIQDNLRL